MFSFFKPKKKEPVFLKTGSVAEEQLQALLELREEFAPNPPFALEQEIRFVKAGITGEKNIAFELENSHMPLYVLHDLFLKHEGLSAQIDYMILTKGHIFVVECKNLFGNIQINEAGDFIRSFYVKGQPVQEGFYSPVTQNFHHMELLREIMVSGRRPRDAKALERSFDQIFRSVIVLANPKTVLDARYAPQEVKRQVIRTDQLISHMKQVDAATGTVFTDREQLQMAQAFLDLCLPQEDDFLGRYRERFQEEDLPVAAGTGTVPVSKEFGKPSDGASGKRPALQVVCPLCGAVMVRRMASRGRNAGKAFYGCKNYPECRGIVNIAED